MTLSFYKVKSILWNLSQQNSPEADLRYVEHLCKRAKNCLKFSISQKIITVLLSYCLAYL